MEELFLQEYQPLVFCPTKKKYQAWAHCSCLSFEGDKGTGKHELSLWLAKRLFVPTCKKKHLAGNAVTVCGLLQGEHPDVIQIEPDGQMIKVDQIRQLQEEFSKAVLRAV